MKNCNHQLIQLCQELPNLFLCKNCGSYFDIAKTKMQDLGRDIPESLIDKKMLICINSRSKEFCDRGDPCYYCKLSKKTTETNCQGESIKNWRDLQAPDY